MITGPVKIKDVTDYLETIAPPSLQESYDNAGLLTGNRDDTVQGVLVTLDCTEPVIEEAQNLGVNLIVAHHPIIFRGLKKLTGATYVERTIIEAVSNNIAIYAIHTNLDNVYEGVNGKIAGKIGLTNTTILVPRRDTLMKLVTFIPTAATQKVMDALHAAGAGHIGDYANCSFRVVGTGTFVPGAHSNPHIGEPMKQESVEEVRVEVLFPAYQEASIMNALRGAHPYEEVAYYLSRLENENQEAGAGMLGELDPGLEPSDFLRRLKDRMDIKVIRHTALPSRKIRKVAICGGAGSFLLPAAIRKEADAYVSADFKYHEFFDAEGRILVADIGHYESEAFTKELLRDTLMKKFPNFAVNFSTREANPVRYYY